MVCVCVCVWWQCEDAGCAFVGQSKASLVNHACQIHGWMAGIRERVFAVAKHSGHKESRCTGSSVQMHPQPALSKDETQKKTKKMFVMLAMLVVSLMLVMLVE